MIDLPIASTEPKHVRALAARQNANAPQHAASPAAGESPFQAALALELGLTPTAQSPQVPLAHAAPAKAGSAFETVVDAAQAAATGDAAVSPAYPGAIAISPAIVGAGKAASVLSAGDDATQNTAGDASVSAAGAAMIPAAVAPHPSALPTASVLPPADTGVTPLPAAEDPSAPAAATAAFALPAAAGVSTLAAASGISPLPAAAGVSPLTAAQPRAAAGDAMTAPDPRRSRLLKESKLRDAGNQLPVTPDTAETAETADFSALGKIAPPIEGQVRSNAPFAANWLDRHTAAPAPAPTAPPAAAASIANHSDGAAGVQLAPVPVATLAARVGNQGWDRGLGDKLVWMTGQKHQVAELHLNPPDLGPLKITLTLNDDQASAQFVCAHLAVREAIESAMPRLREMLADNGIMLGNASVSADAFREQTQPQQHARGYPAQDPAAAAQSGVLAHGELPLRRALGLVDTFA